MAKRRASFSILDGEEGTVEGPKERLGGKWTPWSREPEGPKAWPSGSALAWSFGGPSRGPVASADGVETWGRLCPCPLTAPSSVVGRAPRSRFCCLDSRYALLLPPVFPASFPGPLLLQPQPLCPGDLPLR